MNEILNQRIQSVKIGKDITHAQIVAKRNLREELDRDVKKFLAKGSKVQVLPIGFSHFKDGTIPLCSAKSRLSEEERIERDKALEDKNNEIRMKKAALKAQRKLEIKNKHEKQISEQVRVFGAFVKKSSSKKEFEELAELAGFRVRHLRDCAKGYSKISDERWELVKKLIKNFEFGVAA